jgi:voltage-gated potassium channel
MGALLRSSLVAVFIVLAFFLLPMTAADEIRGGVILGAGLTAVALVLAWHIRMILVAPYPAARAISALVVTVPLFLVVFATIYYLMGAADGAQWSEHLTRMDALYYTVTVFATVGFGDITAVSQAARTVTTLQMIAGLTLVGVIARVVVGAVQVNLRRSGRD